MKYLVVVADDFGLCAGVNRGCLEAFQKGMVTELMFHPGFADKFLNNFSKMTEIRQRDVGLIKDADFQSKISQLGFKVVSFAEIDQAKLK